MPHILPEFQAVAARLQTEFLRSQSVNHSGTKGTIREDNLIEFFRQHLPKRYSIGSGIIADQRTNFSRQQDIVIYDSFNIPVLQDFGDNAVFFAEQVLAAIEVKSRINTHELKDIVQKAQSIRSLQRSSVFHIAGFGTDLQAVASSRIFVFAIAYECDFSLEDTRDRLQAIVDLDDSDWGTSALLILSDSNRKAGIVTNADSVIAGRILLDSNNAYPIGHLDFNTVEDALFYFYLMLLHALQVNSARSFAPDYLGYAQSDGMGGPTLLIGALGGKRTYYYKVVKLMTKAHEVSDDELLDALIWMAHTFERIIPGTYTHPQSRYRIGDGEMQTIVEGIYPWQSWNALNNLANNVLSDTDRLHLAELMKLHRYIAQEGLVYSCGVIATDMPSAL